MEEETTGTAAPKDRAKILVMVLAGMLALILIGGAAYAVTGSGRGCPMQGTSGGSCQMQAVGAGNCPMQGTGGGSCQMRAAGAGNCPMSGTGNDGCPMKGNAGGRCPMNSEATGTTQGQGGGSCH